MNDDEENYDFTTSEMLTTILTPNVQMTLSLEGAKDAITQLAAALQSERKKFVEAEVKLREEVEEVGVKLSEEIARRDALMLSHCKAMSDMEMKMSTLRGREAPQLKDGVRYGPPLTPGPPGPDGFPQKGIFRG